MACSCRRRRRASEERGGGGAWAGLCGLTFGLRLGSSSADTWREGKSERHTGGRRAHNPPAARAHDPPAAMSKLIALALVALAVGAAAEGEHGGRGSARARARRAGRRGPFQAPKPRTGACLDALPLLSCGRAARVLREPPTRPPNLHTTRRSSPHAVGLETVVRWGLRCRRRGRCWRRRRLGARRRGRGRVVGRRGRSSPRFRCAPASCDATRPLPAPRARWWAPTLPPSPSVDDAHDRTLLQWGFFGPGFGGGSAAVSSVAAGGGGGWPYYGGWGVDGFGGGGGGAASSAAAGRKLLAGRELMEGNDGRHLTQGGVPWWAWRPGGAASAAAAAR